MLDSASKYDFTNCPANIATGRSFGYGVCPRLEQELWLNEAVKTAEKRGGFNPLTGEFPAAGVKNDPAVMIPHRSFLTDFQSRINAVLTVPYHNIDSIPVGLVNSLAGTWNLPSAVNYIPSEAWPGNAGISSVAYVALVTPQPVEFPAPRMWTSRPHMDAYSTAVSRAVGDINFFRSAAHGVSEGGLEGYIRKGVSPRTTHRNGAPGNSPMQDWKAGLDVPNPFLNEYGSDYEHNTDHTLVDYYRVKSDANDIAYSLESSSWGFPIDLPSWTHTGAAEALAAIKQTTEFILPVWRIVAAPLWRRTSDNVLVRDKTVSYFAWIGNPNGTMGQLRSVRNTSGQYFYHPANQLSSLVKVFGDYILANAVNMGALPSSGVNGGSSATRVGYVAHVFCAGAVYIARVAPRDIGS